MLPGWSTEEFEANGVVRPILRAGAGPGVVVMHEIPGVTPDVAAFGQRLVDAGYTVVMPVLLGTPGVRLTSLSAATASVRACIAREFSMLASAQASPITRWLRALCRSLHADCGGPGVGAVGMCLTGNFALTLALEPCMLAPVLSQPSLPLPLGRRRKAGLHASPRTVACLRRRAKDEALTVLGLRFTHDVCARRSGSRRCVSFWARGSRPSRSTRRPTTPTGWAGGPTAC